MALITGAAGAISGTGINGLVKSWTANIGRVQLDATHFGAFGKRNLPGNLTVTGSCIATMDDGSNPAAFITQETPATITLTAQGGNTFAFPGTIISADLSLDSAGEALATYNFELNATSTNLTSVAGLYTTAWS